LFFEGYVRSQKEKEKKDQNEKRQNFTKAGDTRRTVKICKTARSTLASAPPSALLKLLFSCLFCTFDYLLHHLHKVRWTRTQSPQVYLTHMIVCKFHSLWYSTSTEHWQDLYFISKFTVYI